MFLIVRGAAGDAATATRRTGAALEHAIFEATLAELSESGYTPSPSTGWHVGRTSGGPPSIAAGRPNETWSPTPSPTACLPWNDHPEPETSAPTC